MTGGVPVASVPPTSIASSATVIPVATVSTAVAGGSSGVALPSSSGTADRPDQYLSRLFSELPGICVMNRPNPTSAFDPFAGVAGIWPPVGAIPPPPAPAPVPVVSRAPEFSLIEALSPEFLQCCNQAQLDMLRPVLRRAVQKPDVPAESEAERRLNALAAYFPESFSLPQPQHPFASTPAPSVYRTLFPTSAEPSRKPDPRSVVNPDVGAQRGSANAEEAPDDATNKLSAKNDALLKINSIKADASLAEEDRMFLIDGVRETVAAVTNVPDCKVPIFKRGNRDLTIDSWFY